MSYLRLILEDLGNLGKLNAGKMMNILKRSVSIDKSHKLILGPVTTSFQPIEVYIDNTRQIRAYGKNFDFSEHSEVSDISISNLNFNDNNIIGIYVDNIATLLIRNIKIYGLNHLVAWDYSVFGENDTNFDGKLVDDAKSLVDEVVEKAKKAGLTVTAKVAYPDSDVIKKQVNREINAPVEKFGGMLFEKYMSSFIAYHSTINDIDKFKDIPTFFSLSTKDAEEWEDDLYDLRMNRADVKRLTCKIHSGNYITRIDDFKNEAMVIFGNEPDFSMFIEENSNPDKFAAFIELLSNKWNGVFCEYELGVFVLIVFDPSKNVAIIKKEKINV